MSDNSRNVMLLGCPVNEKYPLAYQTCKRLSDISTLTDFPLVYSQIDEMIKNGLGDGMDAIVIVGTWTIGGNTDVLLQRGAGRLGYRRLDPDADGKYPSHEEDGKLGLPGSKETYETKVDVDGIVQRLHDAGYESCRVNDTREIKPEEEKFGKWICEYLYCALLQKFEGVKTPVLLVELPLAKEFGGPYALDETEKIVREIVSSVVQGVSK